MYFGQYSGLVAFAVNALTWRMPDLSITRLSGKEVHCGNNALTLRPEPAPWSMWV